MLGIYDRSKPFGFERNRPKSCFPWHVRLLCINQQKSYTHTITLVYRFTSLEANLGLNRFCWFGCPSWLIPSVLPKLWLLRYILKVNDCWLAGDPFLITQILHTVMAKCSTHRPVPELLHLKYLFTKMLCYTASVLQNWSKIDFIFTLCILSKLDYAKQLIHSNCTTSFQSPHTRDGKSGN